MTTAVSASDFSNSLGINTGTVMIGSSYQNYAQMMNALAYLGITNVRETYDTLYSANEFGLMASQLHIKFDFFIALGLASPEWQLGQIAADPSIVSYVEGYNESDSWWQTFHGATGVAATQAVQEYIYNFVHSTPSLANVGVLQTTFANQPVSYPLYGNMGAYADYASTHSYFGTGNAPAGGIAWLLANGQMATPNKPTITTESGYFTMPTSSSGVSQIVQAKYLLDVLFDQANAGVKLTYLWELADNYADPGNTNSEDHYGLYNYDWTPKLAALALHNLGQIMHDPAGGTPAPGSLNWTFSSLPADAQTALYQKADGTFLLVVWNEARLSGPATSTDITVAPIHTTLNLAQSFANIAVFDPLTGTGAIQTAQNTASLNFDLLDHPIIIALSQAAIAGTVAPAIAAPDRLLTMSGQAVYVDGLSVAASNTGTLTMQITSGGAGLTINDQVGHILARNVDHLSLTGTAATLDAELASLTYTAPAGMSGDTVSVTLTDATGATTTRAIPVSIITGPTYPDDGGPALSVPASITTAPGYALRMPSLSVVDGYAAARAGTVSFTAQTLSGRIGADGSLATVSGNASSSLTVTGSFAQVAAALATLTYTGIVGATADTITSSITDQGGFTSSGTTQVALTALPLLTTPAAISAGTGGAVTIGGLLLTDAAAAAISSTVRMVLQAGSGTLASAAAGAAGSGTQTLTLSGTVAALDAALQNVTYSPEAGGADDTIALSVTDIYGGSAAASISVLGTAATITTVTTATTATTPTIAAVQLQPATTTTTTTAAITPTTTAAQTQTQPATSTETWRFFDTRDGSQFLATSTTERDTVIATRHDLIYEGSAFGMASASDPAATPIYRFFSTVDGSHFYTMNAQESNTLRLTRPDLVWEGATFYEHASAMPGDTTVYRFFDTTDGNHLYTSSVSEVASIKASRPDMVFEGAAFYAPS